MRAAYYAGLFESVNTFVRSNRSAVVAFLLSLKPLGGDPCDGGGEVCPFPQSLGRGLAIFFHIALQLLVRRQQERAVGPLLIYR